MSIRINGQVIPPEAIEYELGRLVRFYSEHMPEAEIRKQLDVLRERAKQQAIGAKLLLDEAGRLDLAVPEEQDVLEKLNEVVTSCGGREAFDALLKKQNVSEASVRAGIVQGRRVDMLVDRVAAGLSDPSEEELRAHFEEHPDEYLRPARASAQHILAKFEGDSAIERATAKAKLERIRRDMQEGAAFADQAAIHSDCPSGKEAGGNLGWFSRGMMVPEFDNAVFAMKVGELSELIESPFGFHLIEKTGEEAGGPAEYDAVREKIRDFLRHARRGEAIAAYVAELRTKVMVEED
ncbi:MAG: peptidylprolyl isomerase [Verrucomicrobia bacterium]|nr:peptidylprolyl isomerase [Verrucomicrobiota bacterium]